MENCKLCLIKNADFSGSHIIPHFLMKRIDNMTGTTARDNELGFVFRESETTSYFGRSVLPEKLNEVFGVLTDEELGNYKSPMVVNNFFCSDCESKFAQIENEYAKTLKVKTADSKLKSGLGLLFWISVLWRISILKELGLILQKKEEELLRLILDHHLNLKCKDIDIERLKADIKCSQLAYRIIRCPDYSSEEATSLFCSPFHRMHYCVLIDEFVVLFYFKKGRIDNLIQTFGGFENDIKGKIYNTVHEGEVRIIYERELFKKCSDEISKLMAEQMYDAHSRICDTAHEILGGQGKTMPPELKLQILERLASGGNFLGRKNTFNVLIKLIYDEYLKITKIK
jgi:hypothetical protein